MGETGGSLTDVFTFDAAALSSSLPANAPIREPAAGDGGARGALTLTGANFGRAAYTPRVRVGGCQPPPEPWTEWYGTNFTIYCEHGFSARTAATVTASNSRAPSRC